jgi:hypothetical protein
VYSQFVDSMSLNVFYFFFVDLKKTDCRIQDFIKKITFQTNKNELISFIFSVVFVQFKSFCGKIAFIRSSLNFYLIYLCL